MTTEPRDVELLLVPGALMCLAKPFELDDVLTCVAGYVQTLKARSESVAQGGYAAASA
jgi:hypothetical protein